MSNISKIDKNFEVKPLEEGQDTVFLNCLEAPFKVYGLMLPKDENDVYRRLPLSVVEALNESVVSLSHHTAGGVHKLQVQLIARIAGLRVNHAGIIKLSFTFNTLRTAKTIFNSPIIWNKKFPTFFTDISLYGLIIGSKKFKTVRNNWLIMSYRFHFINKQRNIIKTKQNMEIAKWFKFIINSKYRKESVVYL